MKIVLLEGLGVSRETLQKHARRLEAMGHMFTVYERDPDPGVQAERCRDADVLMLANMPLAPSALEAAKELKFINVAFLYRCGSYPYGPGQAAGHCRE